jgi:ribonuclease HI
MGITTRYLTVTRGNLANKHLYLSHVLDLFPPETVGGSDASRLAQRCLRIHWGSETVETDIDGTKKIFRKRGWVRRFFQANGFRPGDRVLLEQLEPYVYRVSRLAADAEAGEGTCRELEVWGPSSSPSARRDGSVGPRRLVTAYTCGICLPSGAGGYGVVLLCDSHRKELSGSAPDSSKNRMDLLAAVEALRALKLRCQVRLLSTNTYVTDAIHKGWADRWRSEGWQNSDERPTPHAGLWEALLGQCSRHEATFQWLPFDPADPNHVRCDALARRAIREMTALVGGKPLSTGAAVPAVCDDLLSKTVLAARQSPPLSAKEAALELIRRMPEAVTWEQIREEFAACAAA